MELVDNKSENSGTNNDDDSPNLIVLNAIENRTERVIRESDEVALEAREGYD